ncbi:guanylyl cyclase [Rhizobium sp. AC44/96]|uniref:adenylate/guanylate cyclase domain-containing protein n=1 Tax=Rhizobium sp. AC44/96 TaxID=1841654 RepID=UPI0008100FD4|nr:adenylate/guanylate cyclase domain-containing protein [Rhizobium sp. AC44/96]OCJ07928.1 guanylyl cyclase [Rhizobium sp. AC44/96]
MDLSDPIAWLVDDAAASPSAASFLRDLGRRLEAEGLPLAGGALTLAVAHPIIAHRTSLWRADTGVVGERLGFLAGAPDSGQRGWLEELGPLFESAIGKAPDTPVLGWAGKRPFDSTETGRLNEVARFALAPLAAIASRAAQAALLETYLGRRSAVRVQSGALSRGTGEIIRAALLCADLRDFTTMSETTEPLLVIAALDAWFERLAGAVHAFGGEVLKFMGDGLLAIFPVTATPAEACDAALNAVVAARAGMAHLEVSRQAQGLAPLPFGVAVHFGEILWGNIGAADRLDFTAIGPAVNLVSRLEGLCKPLHRTVLVSGEATAQASKELVSLGEHRLRGIDRSCLVFTLPDG